MGKQMPDVCGRSPAKVKMEDYKASRSRQGRRLLRCCGFCLPFSWLLAILFAVLFVWQQLIPEPAPQLETCKTIWQNQTTELRSTIALLGQRVEAQESEREKATAEGDEMRVQLATANRTIQTTSEKWEACQKQLESLEHNVTFLVSEAVQREMEKYKRAEEEIKHLKRQLFDKLQDLNDMEMKMQQQQETCQATIQHLQRHLMNHSHGNILHGTFMVLLPFILAKLFL